MIKHLAAILKSLPADMPQPRITSNSDTDGVFLHFLHAHNFQCANLTVQVAEMSDGSGVIAWCGYPRLTDTKCISGSQLKPFDVPAELLDLFDTFAQTVRESQREQVEA